MTIKNNHLPLIFFLGIPLLLISFLLILVHSSVFQNNPSNLSLAITLDLVITLPFLYFLLIRKQGIPKITVASVFLAGIFIASWIIPKDQQYLLDLIKMVALPLVEMGVLSYIGINLYRTFHTYKKEKAETPDFFDALTIATDKILPTKISRVLAGEIAIIYYTLFNWKKAIPKANEFTYHQKSGIVLVIYVFMALIIVETGVVHLILERWNPRVALIVGLLSVYSCLQMYALTCSMSKRFITIDEAKEVLILRYGFFSDTTINIADIEKIEKTRRTLPESKGVVQFSPLDMLDSHNLIIYLKKEEEMIRLYGRRKKYQILSLYVDDRDAFCATLEKLGDLSIS